MRTSLVTVAACGGVIALLAFAFAGPSAGLSATVGAAVATGNLWALAHIIAALLPADGEGARAQSQGAWALVAALKVAGLVAVIWLLMRHGVVSPIPMLFGFAALPIGIAIASLVSDRNAPARTGEPAPPRDPREAGPPHQPEDP